MNETRNLAIKDLLEAIELVDRAYEKIHKVSNTITVNEAHNPSTININIETIKEFAKIDKRSLQYNNKRIYIGDYRHELFGYIKTELKRSVDALVEQGTRIRW